MVIDNLLRGAGEGEEEKKPRGLIQWKGRSLPSFQPYDVMTNITLRYSLTCHSVMYVELFSYHMMICKSIMESAKPEPDLLPILTCIPMKCMQLK